MHIQHRVHIAGSKGAVFSALSEIEGLSQWWTRDTTGDSRVGGDIDFRFGGHLCTMAVRELRDGEGVEWECLVSAPEWIGTRVRFELEPGEDGCAVNFSHRGWLKASDFFGHCSMKWAVFLLSLKQYVETGQGAPFPDDISI